MSIKYWPFYRFFILHLNMDKHNLIMQICDVEAGHIKCLANVCLYYFSNFNSRTFFDIDMSQGIYMVSKSCLNEKYQYHSQSENTFCMQWLTQDTDLRKVHHYVLFRRTSCCIIINILVPYSVCYERNIEENFHPYVYVYLKSAKTFHRPQ